MVPHHHAHTVHGSDTSVEVVETGLPIDGHNDPLRIAKTLSKLA